MIVIIKMGKMRRYEATCPNCDTVVRFYEKDIVKKEFIVPDKPCVITTRYIKCPLCKEKIEDFKKVDDDCSESN